MKDWISGSVSDQKDELAARFMRYAAIDTQSDPHSKTFPSTEKQKNLAALLVDELQAAGIADAAADQYGYVYATIPSNSQKPAPVICFCAHMDTAPDCSGTGVRPLLHRDYDGGDIVLPDDPQQVIRAAANPYLREKKGDDIITASGKTLLGADDKSGVAVIMQLASWLVKKPEHRHGMIRLLFTPDEEVGRGVDKLDLEKLGADYAYTLDAGEAGMLEDETFHADSLELTVTGVSAHPGYAKGRLVNALKIAGELLTALPTEQWSPETTAGREGFVHPVHMTGNAEKATLGFIVRDFDRHLLQKHRERLDELARRVTAKHPGASISVDVREQYRNMREVIDRHPRLKEYAAEAYRQSGLEPRTDPVRGGTDGSRLSFMGLPCPNIFTGMQNIHGLQEWVSVQDMLKSLEVLIRLVGVWEERA